MPHRPVIKLRGMRIVLSDWISSNSVGESDEPERGKLGEHIVDFVVRVRHFDRDLSEVVGVRARENLFVVRQILRRGGDVILDIGEVESLGRE